jgi:hypothetical protein
MAFEVTDSTDLGDATLFLDKYQRIWGTTTTTTPPPTTTTHSFIQQSV